MDSSQKGKTRIAIIGYGIIGPHHAQAILKSQDTRLVAVVDVVPTIASAAAEKLGAHYYPSIAELLASPHKPDAAIICTPNHTHANAAKELTGAGVHILIEKPFSTDVEVGNELLVHLKEARVKTGVMSLVGHHRRFNPYAVSTAAVISSGSLGRIIAINGLWATCKPTSYFDATWRRTKAAGPVLINLVHDVDLLHHFLGPIVRVQTEKTISRRGFEAEEGAAIIFKFKSGVVGTFFLCDNVPSPYGWDFGTGENPNFPNSGQDFYRIFGTEASFSVPDMTRWSYDSKGQQSWNEKMVPEKIDIGTGVSFELQLAHFLRVIASQEVPSCTPEAGLAALIVCEAIKKSLESGTPVDILEYEL
ncbi:NAD(P)-binding protein [Thozetella sp. PMI_491]|nr:NAD(P)-binding protein [Thozetella sp. PMI_491]